MPRSTHHVMCTAAVERIPLINLVLLCFNKKHMRTHLSRLQEKPFLRLSQMREKPTQQFNNQFNPAVEVNSTVIILALTKIARRARLAVAPPIP
jgi:hypothetical protein